MGQDATGQDETYQSEGQRWSEAGRGEKFASSASASLYLYGSFCLQFPSKAGLVKCRQELQKLLSW